MSRNDDMLDRFKRAQFIRSRQFVAAVALLAVVTSATTPVNAQGIALNNQNLSTILQLKPEKPAPKPKPAKPKPPAPAPIIEIQLLDFVPYPIAPIGTYANTYDFGNCTAYVAGRINIPNSWGNANTWAIRAEAMGYTVSDIPIVGTIAQSSRGGYGHVAVVIAVSGNMVQVSEMNVRGFNLIDESWSPISDFKYIWPI